MRSKDDKGWLADIRENIVLAQSFVGNASRQDFPPDRLTSLAVQRCLEVISEASYRLSAAVRDRHPALPWAEICRAQALYFDNYREVRDDVIWTTVKKELPPLLAAVEAELARA